MVLKSRCKDSQEDITRAPRENYSLGMQRIITSKGRLQANRTHTHMFIQYHSESFQGMTESLMSNVMRMFLVLHGRQILASGISRGISRTKEHSLLEELTGVLACDDTWRFAGAETLPALAISASWRNIQCSRGRGGQRPVSWNPRCP